MQPDQAGPPGMEMRCSPRDGDRLAVNSRRRALDRLWTGLQAGLNGPVLITGESGAGKRWLAGRFAERLPAGWRSAGLELSSALDGPEMLRLIGDPIGLEMSDRLGAARLQLAAALRDDAADGRNWLLILGEVQLATAGAWEEIQALSNQLGRPGGFAAMILLGRTELARELSARRRQGWASRLALHIHLPPLDLDEARALLRLEGRATGPELETLHRDAMGNPRAMLRLAATWGRGPRPASTNPAGPAHGILSSPSSRPGDEPLSIEEGEETHGEIPVVADDVPPPKLPSLIPARPPIRLEDGLVEVGWEGDLEAEPTRGEAAPSGPEAVPATEVEHHEELVDDRYAALQAWAEWSRNRERPVLTSADPTALGTAVHGEEDRPPRPSGPQEADDMTVAAPSVRAEPPQEFAPYSQLFSRLRHPL